MTEGVATRGAELRPGDCIKVWWRPFRDIVTDLTPYDGPIAYVFPAGARLATFALCRTGMTIPNDEVYEVLYRYERAGSNGGSWED